MSKKYDPDLFHRKSSWIVRFLERERVKWVLRYVDAQPDDRILEVGCGAGNVLEQIRCGELYGVDLSNYMVENARRRLGSRARIRKADAEKLPFGDGYFTKVFCTEVLEHVLHPETAVAEMSRVLAPQGRLIVSVPNERLIMLLKRSLKRLGIYALVLRIRDGYHAAEVNEWHLHEFDLERLRQTLRPFFLLEKVKAVPNRVFSMHYVSLCRRP
jgi:ubiquinone/menaquinone biosynthesis C-methylase UbiE